MQDVREMETDLHALSREKSQGAKQTTTQLLPLGDI